MRSVKFLILAATLSACAATPSRPTNEANKAAVFAQPLPKVHKAATDGLVVLGFDVAKSEPNYIEGQRPRKMGLFVGSGGETVGIWLEAVGDASTRVEVDTARSLVGIAGQQTWDTEIFGELQRSLGAPTRQ